MENKMSIREAMMKYGCGRLRKEKRVKEKEITESKSNKTTRKLFKRY